MKHRHMLIAAALAIAVTACVFSFARSRPPEQLTLDERITKSLESISSPGRRSSNAYKASHEAAGEIKAATPKSLKLPRVVASLYFPDDKKTGTVGVMLRWIEVTPSLETVTVTNPETRKSQDIKIPHRRLQEAMDSEMHGMIFGYWAELSREVAGDNPTQALEAVAKGQSHPATVYPSTLIPGN
jgi:hypothetical protein